METNENICSSGKVVFNTKAEIKRYIRVRNQRVGGDGFRYYRCQECGKYHLTTRHAVDDWSLKKHANKYNRLTKKAEDKNIYKHYHLAV